MSGPSSHANPFGTVFCAVMGTSFGSKLEHLMLDAGLNRVKLARKMGVSKQTVGRWCSGESYPDMLQAQKMAHLLGDVSLDWWVNAEADYPPTPGRPLGGAVLDPRPRPKPKRSEGN